MKKVIIIGGGPAGLSCAYKLLKDNKDVDVTILEEDKMVGGIAKTINYKGNRMDLGGHRFFSKNKEVNDFWKEILPIQGVDSYDDKVLGRNKKFPKSKVNPEKEDEVFLVRDRISRIYYQKKFFDYPVTLNMKTILNLGLFKTIICGFSYIKSCIFKKKEDSLENFYINRFGKKLYSIFFEGYTEKLWGKHPRDISADWGAQRVKGISILLFIKNFFLDLFHIKKKNQETSLIESFYYPKYGPGQMWEVTLDRIINMGGKIIYNAKVTKLNYKKKKFNSVTYEIDGKEVTLKGDYIVSSMPIKDLINGIKDVSKDIKNIGTKLPYRDFITVGLLVNKLKLKNKTDYKTINDIIPDTWLYIQDSSVKLGRIQVFNNWSPYLVKDINNTVWIGLEYFCTEGDYFWKMSDEKRKVLAVSELESMGIIDSGDVLDYHTEKVRKAYPAYFGTYKDFDKVVKYLNSFDNLYCIGRNGQHRYNNMDHSMLTGFYTAEAIGNGNKTKDDIWNVNSEKEYHEENKNVTN